MKPTMVKTLKTVNFMAGKATSLAEIKRHRKMSDLACRLATPLGDVERKGFRVDMRREAHFRQNIYFRKDEAGNPIWKDTYVYAMTADES